MIRALCLAGALALWTGPTAALDLLFTARGGDAEVADCIARAKAGLAAAGVLETRTRDDGTVEIANPDNVIGPRRGSAARAGTDGEGNPWSLPARGDPDETLLVIRTRAFTLAQLAAAMGLDIALAADGQVALFDGCTTLWLPPAEDAPQVFHDAYADVVRRQREVVGFWQ